MWPTLLVSPGPWSVLRPWRRGQYLPRPVDLNLRDPAGAQARTAYCTDGEFGWG